MNYCIKLSEILSSDSPRTGSIVYLIIGIICMLAGCALCWLTYRFMKNKPDYNRAQQMNWFTKWIYKNRMLIIIMTTIIVLAWGICLILMYCGVVPNFGNNYSS